MTTIGSFVEFYNDDIRVFTYTDAVDEDTRLQGVAILISCYVLRLCATVSVDRAAKNLLQHAFTNPESLDSVINTLFDEYERRLGLPTVKITYNHPLSKPQRSLNYIINYGQAGSYAGQFKPKGFGMLGKNVELSSIISCLLTIRYFLDSEDRFPYASETVYTTLNLLRQYIEVTPKIGVAEEMRIVHKIIEAQFS